MIIIIIIIISIALLFNHECNLDLYTICILG